MTYNELKLRIEDWAEARGIFEKSTPFDQILKTLEELGETADAIIFDDKAKIQDGFGDILVTLIIGARLNGIDLLDCLELAYNEIKDRKGKMVNGVFVKEETNEHS